MVAVAAAVVAAAALAALLAWGSLALFSGSTAAAGRGADQRSLPAGIQRQSARPPVPGPSGSAPSTAPPTPVGSASRPSYAVADDTLVLTDPTRDTPARGTVTGHPGRILRTVIRRPIGATGPLPLVVFAHGWDSEPETYEPLLDRWAQAGFLVAAPEFPDSAHDLAGSPVSNYPEQARDLSFVVTSLSSGEGGAVDPTSIAVAGHSDGGTDVALLALNPMFADHRFAAYLSLSGEIPAGVDGAWGTTPTPGALLVVVGAQDQYGLLGRSTQVYESARMQKAILTVTGGDHLGTYIGATGTDADVREATVRFLEASLPAGSLPAGGLDSALRPTTANPSIRLQVAAG